MASYLVPSNNKEYNVIRALHELGRTEWNQKIKRIKEGDIVYIYISSPIKAIVFQCKVLKVNIKSEDASSEYNKYILSTIQTDDTNTFMLLELIKEIDNNILTNQVLQKAKGKKLSVQGQQEITGQLEQYIINEFEKINI